MSRKIVFVEKEEGSYDPVMAFFNKKQTTASKNSNQTTKPASTAKATSTAKPNDSQNLTWKTSTEKTTNNTIKQPVSNSKIAKNQVAVGSKPYPPKQQALKTRDLSKNNLKRQSKTNLLSTTITKEIQEEQKVDVEPKQDSLEKISREQLPKKADKNETQKTNQKKEDLSKKIAQLQVRQQEYLRRIEEFQAREEKYVKNEQKLQKLQKQMKAAVQKSKEAETVLQKLKDKQLQIKEMLESKSIPFSRKREVILSNKLKELKRTNRQLVLRLKSYKGTDLVELSMQQNREEIMKDLYTVDVEKQLKQEMNVEMESLVSQLAQKIEQYIQKRIKEKEQRLEWGQQHTWLLELMHLSEQISLKYLQNYEIAPLPQSNQEAQSAYSILEEYTQSNQMQKLMDRFNLNISLSKDNLSLIEYLQQSSDEMISIKKQVGLSKRKKQIDMARLKNYMSSLQKRANFQEIIVIHSICQVQLTREWLEKVHTQVNEQLSSLSKAFSQIRDIVAVGQSAKDSLYYYLSNSLQNIIPKFPLIKNSLRQIRVDFQELQRFCQPKEPIK